MNQYDWNLDNRNLKSMLKLILNDIADHCVDCKHGFPQTRRHTDPGCDRCGLGKYQKAETNNAELNLMATFAKAEKTKKENT